MNPGSPKKILWMLAVFLAALLGVRYLLPVIMPFLMGLLIALAAEPVVGFGVRRLRMPRALAAGIGVSVTLVLAAGLLSFLGALAVKELGNLANALPDMESTLQNAMLLCQDFLVGLAQRMPDGMRTVMTGWVLEWFDDGSALLGQLTGRIPGMLSALLGWIPDGALGLGTGILAGYMISARLVRLRQYLSGKIPQSWKEKYLPALQRVRKTLGSWLKAQGKLVLVTYGILTAGFLLLGIPYGMVWALPVALVDAVPVLGTGTVLIPWAVVTLLQGQTWMGLGLLGIYVVALLSRTVLEPRLVGRHLGLDPLLTLAFLYVGYRLWGIFGMILAPMLAAAAKSLTQGTAGNN